MRVLVIQVSVFSTHSMNSILIIKTQKYLFLLLQVVH